MIYDKLSNLTSYLGFCKNLDTALTYLASHDLNSLPMGKTMIDGDHVFLNVMEASAAPSSEKKFEIHKNYMDIQIDLIGTELIEIGDAASMQTESYQEETDFGTVSCKPLVSCTMGVGNFIICMAGEPHKPGVAAEENIFLKKCVVKVHI